MKIPVIKQLTEKYGLEELKKAESDIEEGNKPDIEIPGDDEGEQLTHAYAAAWILEKIQKEQMDFKDALRSYTAMVRGTIS
jgi:hypothetical protein